MTMYRPKLISAESNIWAHSLPASEAANAAGAIAKANAALTKYMTDAYQNTCKAYGPDQQATRTTTERPSTKSSWTTSKRAQEKKNGSEPTCLRKQDLAGEEIDRERGQVR